MRKTCLWGRLFFATVRSKDKVDDGPEGDVDTWCYLDCDYASVACKHVSTSVRNTSVGCHSDLRPVCFLFCEEHFALRVLGARQGEARPFLACVESGVPLACCMNELDCVFCTSVSARLTLVC